MEQRWVFIFLFNPTCLYNKLGFSTIPYIKYPDRDLNN